MNMLSEGLKEKATRVIVPSPVLNTMTLERYDRGGLSGKGPVRACRRDEIGQRRS